MWSRAASDISAIVSVSINTNCVGKAGRLLKAASSDGKVK